MKVTEFLKLFSKYGSLRKIAENTEYGYHTVRAAYQKAKETGKIQDIKNTPKLSKEDVIGRINRRSPKPVPLPKSGCVKRYLFTCAQNNTLVHPRFWENLNALAQHYNAEIHVSRFLYIKAGLGAIGDKARLVKRSETHPELWWDSKLEKHFSDEQLLVAPTLSWCGEQNILPTAKRPLSALNSYTQERSGIFPHVKVALESVPGMKGEDTKIIYTTGACTLRNYIQKRAGLDADFHHVYGALLVEVEADGTWYARQVLANNKGVICDLDLKVSNGKVTQGNRVEAITWGDIHVEKLDPLCRDTIVSKDGMLAKLKPRYQFVHDLLDFSRRSRHKADDFHQMFASWCAGKECVKDEVLDTGKFLLEIERKYCQTYVVYSNHDDMLTRWLKTADYKKDPINAVFFLECQLETLKAIQEGRNFQVYEWVLRQNFPDLKAKFLELDTSFRVLGVEQALHGDKGADGARGSVHGLSRASRKINMGHVHKASIRDGVYSAGVNGLLDMGYNKGISSWSHSDIVTYSNGKRAIITKKNGKWHAKGKPS